MLKPLIAFFCVLSSWATLVQAEDLKFFCEVDGQALTFAGMDARGQPQIQKDGSKREAPKTAAWRLEGDLREQAEWIAWSPRYEIARCLDVELRADPGRPFKAKVEFHGLPREGVFSETGSLAVEQLWPGAIDKKAAIVAVWIVDGRVVQASAPLSVAKTANVLRAEYRLTNEEAEGQGALICVSGQGLEKPAPLFADENAQRALVATLFNDAGEVRQYFKTNPQGGSVLSKTGEPLLHYAVAAGARAVTGILVTDAKARAKPGDRTSLPLVIAAGRGRAETCWELIRAGYDKNAGVRDLGKPLINAVRHGHLAVVNILTGGQSEADAKSANHRTAFAEAIQYGYVDILEALTPYVVFSVENNERFQTMLRGQAASGHAGTVRWLISRKVSPHTMDLSGDTALLLAARRGHAEVIEVLLQARVDHAVVGKRGNTPLMLAGLADSAASVDALVKGGADLKARDKNLATPLHIAALAGSTSSVQAMLKHKADIKAVDKAGATPLEEALRSQSPETVDAIVKAGARIDLLSSRAEAMIEAALRVDNAELISRAIKDGWSANAPHKKGWSSLAIARTVGATQCVPVLIAAGAAADSKPPYEIVTGKAVETAPKIITATMPVDPRGSNEVYDTQSVLVDLLVDKDGAVLFPKIVHAPDHRLGLAVMAVISNWKFHPAQVAGQPVTTRLRVPVRFPASADREYVLVDVDEKPKALSQPPPAYPEKAANSIGDARVIIEFTLDKQGVVKTARAVEQPNPLFGDAAVAAVLKWRFTPAKVNGQAVAIRARVPITFNQKTPSFNDTEGSFEENDTTL